MHNDKKLYMAEACLSFRVIVQTSFDNMVEASGQWGFGASRPLNTEKKLLLCLSSKWAEMYERYENIQRQSINIKFCNPHEDPSNPTRPPTASANSASRIRSYPETSASYSGLSI